MRAFTTLLLFCCCAVSAFAQVQVFTTATYRDSNCANTPDLGESAVGPTAMWIIGDCYYFPINNNGATTYSTVFTYDSGTQVVTQSLYADKDCDGSPASSTSFSLASAQCDDAGGGFFQKSIVTSVARSSLVGFASWNHNSFVDPSGAAAACFPEIKDFAPAPGGGAGQSFHLLGGICLTTPNGESVEVSGPPFSSYASLDCSGTPSSFDDCKVFANTTGFLGDIESNSFALAPSLLAIGLSLIALIH